MTATQAKTVSIRTYLAVLVAGWILLGSGAWEYARFKAVPGGLAVPIGAAFLVEFPFYLLPGFPGVMRRLGLSNERTGNARLSAACAMAASGLIPYVLYSVPCGVFDPRAVAVLALICASVAFWYIALPRRGATDALFLALLAAIILSRVFNGIYIDPVPNLHVEYLGHVMLIRLAAMAVIAVRGGSGTEFRFWPTGREWIAGARWFAALMPFAMGVYWALGLVNWRPHPLGLPLAIATFFGILWVLALSEEFFFRGLLQRWLEAWLGAPVAALLLTSVLFGAAHLGFAHSFPNWRFSTVAGVAGVFYGLAWRETRTVQSSMVTHALVVTVWRVFLR